MNCHGGRGPPGRCFGRFIPGLQTCAHNHAITPHGRPAGEQWRGGPGGGFASPTGSSLAARGERSRRANPGLFQKPATPGR